MTPTNTQLVPINWHNQTVHIEATWVGNAQPDAPLMVFLHEGLGSVSMWRGFPQQLCTALGWRGLVYSRPGYGSSTPRPAHEQWGPDFLHRQAREVLPALLAALGVDATRQPIWLLGHSDGGSAALLFAAHHPEQVAGVVVLAPHILVEDVSVSSIELARQAYIQTDLRQKLARHHDNPDSAFWGWNRVWLSPAFRDWNITAELATITAPVLAMQGLNDEYGSLEQIRGIARVLPATQLLELPGCGHSPHRDQPAAVVAAVLSFVHTQAHTPHPEGTTR